MKRSSGTHTLADSIWGGTVAHSLAFTAYPLYNL